MLYVSPIVEALRGRPRLVFWTATLIQALFWILIPSLFYASPPGDVPLVLALGHEWPLGTVFGPPLADWLAEAAFRAAGRSVVGVYILAQVCVVVAFWAVFALGRAMVGLTHAALAVLLMIGVSLFSVPTADFGPAVLAMPLTALSLLFYWRAMGEGDRRYWFALGLVLGLGMLTTYFAALLFALMLLFTLVTARGRARLRTPFPYLAVVIAIVVALPHLLWLWQHRRNTLLVIGDVPIGTVALQWVAQLSTLVVNHAGFLVLLIVAGALAVDRRILVPALVREPTDPLARLYVYFFAVAPLLLATLIAAIAGDPEPLGGSQSLVLLTGLAAILLAGDVIRLHRQSSLGWTFAALLIAPPIVAVLGVIVLPWTIAAELKINEPSAAMGRFFTESFNRRTGRPLAIVVGDARLGGLVALDSPQRPSLVVDAAFENAPWVSADDIRQKGAIVVWPLTDPAGAPPAHFRARFPAMVPEVPRAFDWNVRGRLPLLRVGWAMIRPQGRSE